MTDTDPFKGYNPSILPTPVEKLIKLGHAIFDHIRYPSPSEHHTIPFEEEPKWKPDQTNQL